jgi:hypothetical protein
LRLDYSVRFVGAPNRPFRRLLFNTDTSQRSSISIPGTTFWHADMKALAVIAPHLSQQIENFLRLDILADRQNSEFFTRADAPAS